MNVNDKVEEIKQQLQAELSKRFLGVVVFSDQQDVKEALVQMTVDFLSRHCQAEDRIKVNVIQEGNDIRITAGNLYTFILLCGYERPSPHCRDWMKEWETSKALYKYNEIKGEYECYLLHAITINCKLEYPQQ